MKYREESLNEINFFVDIVQVIMYGIDNVQ